MGFLDVAFLPSRASFPPHFLNIVVEVKALRQPHVLSLWLGVSKGIFPMKYFFSNNASFCISRISWKSHDCYKVEVNLATLTLGGIT